MRVFNLTDVRTDVLEQRGMLAQHIGVAGRMIAPGEYADVETSSKAMSDLEYLVRIGAVAIDTLPPPYVLAKQVEAANASSSTRRVAHVNLPETKVAGESVPGPAVEGASVALERNDPMNQESDAPPEPAPAPAPVAGAKKKK